MKCVVCEEMPAEVLSLCLECDDSWCSFGPPGIDSEANPVEWAARRARELEREACARQLEARAEQKREQSRSLTRWDRDAKNQLHHDADDLDELAAAIRARKGGE